MPAKFAYYIADEQRWITLYKTIQLVEIDGDQTTKKRFVLERLAHEVKKESRQT